MEMFETKEEYLAVVSKMKTDYKETSNTIRNYKLGRKPAYREDNNVLFEQGNLVELKQKARAFNIVYGLLKGREYKQIERQTREGNEAVLFSNTYYVGKVCEKYSVDYPKIMKAVQNA